jgi:aminoglycoside phosphotransferase (APT) family kinase protein
VAAHNMPAAEVVITDDLVRGLLRDQHPDLLGFPLSEFTNGWDNIIFRLGDEYAVRLPRREMAAGPLLDEQRWLPELASRLPLPIPAPVRVGVPGRGYPWHWSVCPWLLGEVAAESVLANPTLEAARLGEFVSALHQPAPEGLPVNAALRGQPLHRLTDRLDLHLTRGAVARPDNLRDRWHALVAVDEWTAPPVFLHGDLHTANLLVDDGAISAVIDFGDLAAGDPAVDLAIAWMLFDEPARSAFRAGAGAAQDNALWSRAEAWALYFAVIYVSNSADNSLIASIGGELLEALISD